MIYTTGTIAGSGNMLTGTGTNFAAAGSLIRNGSTVIVLTSPPQVFQITAVNSATQLAVTPAVNPAIPSGTRYAILLSDSLSVDGLAQDIAETFKMYQAYMSGFADVMTGTGNVTITINGTSVTVPAQKSLAQKGANGAVPIASGGSGATNAVDALTNLGALPAAGASGLKAKYSFNASGSNVGISFSDTPSSGFGSVFNGWNGMPISFNTNVTSNGQFNPHIVHRYFYSGVAAGAFFIGTSMSTSDQSLMIGHTTSEGQLSSAVSFNRSGNVVANNGQFVSASDERIKRDIKRIEDPLDKMRAIKGVTYYRRDNNNFGIGFIAQDVQQVFPEAVMTNSFSPIIDGKQIDNVLFPDTPGVAAALHHEAILAIMDKNNELTDEVTALKEDLAALKEQVNLLISPPANSDQ